MQRTPPLLSPVCGVFFMRLCVHPVVSGKQSRLYLLKDKLSDGPQGFLTCPKPTIAHVSHWVSTLYTVLTFKCSILLGSSDVARMLACCL